MQRKRLWFVPSVISISLIGCTAPGPVPPGPAAPAVSISRPQAGNGVLSFRIDWSNLEATYQTQAIPDRAFKATIALLDKDGAPAKDSSGATIPMREFVRSSNYFYSYASWQLPAQSGLTVRAQLFDASGQSLVVRERVIDVVPGVNAWLSIDMTPDDAPVIEGVSEEGVLSFERSTVLTGQHFGKSKGWKALAILESRLPPATHSIGATPTPYVYSPPVTLPEQALSVDSDGQVTLTLRPTEAQWLNTLQTYFAASSSYELWLMLQVDGVKSKAIKVSLPRSAAVTAALSLETGGNAAYDSAQPRELQLLQPPFSVPIASGSTWIYGGTETEFTVGAQTTSLYTASTFRYQVWCDGNERQGRYEERRYSNGSSVGYVVGSGRNYDLGYSPTFRFSDSYASIVALPDETLTVPGYGERLAKHYSFSNADWYTGSTLSEIWIVPTIGLVKRKDITLVPNGDKMNKRIRTWDLLEYQPPLSTTVN